MASIPLESIYANLGSAIGGGLTSALDNLAKAKIQQLNHTNGIQNFKKMGYSDHDAEYLYSIQQNPQSAKGLNTALQLLSGPRQALAQEQSPLQNSAQAQQQNMGQQGQAELPGQTMQPNIRQLLAQQPAIASLLGQPNASAALMQNPAIASLLGMGGLGQGQMPNATRDLGLNRLPVEPMQQAAQRRPAQAGVPGQQPIGAQQISGQMVPPQAIPPELSTRERIAANVAAKGEGAASTKEQAAIDRVEAPYLKRLETKKDALREIVDKAGKMQELLEKGADDDSQVSSGWKGYLSPTRTLGSASEQFSNLSDDVAAALTSLSTGVQTISKIKFNQQRKPNLGQNRLTQEERTEDLLDYGKKGFLEQDLTDFLINKNNGNNPKALSKTVNQIYSKLERNIPPVPEGSHDGQVFNDNKNKVQWRVDGPIMRFNGFIGE